MKTEYILVTLKAAVSIRVVLLFLIILVLLLATVPQRHNTGSI